MNFWKDQGGTEIATITAVTHQSSFDYTLKVDLSKG